MEFNKKIISWWFKITPPWLRLAIAVLIVVFPFILSVSSCSSTRAVIRQPKDSSVTHISISTNNPMDITASPNVSPNLNSPK